MKGTEAKPLWIEVVTDTYVPDINGVANSLGRLCSGLRELGHRVEIIRSGRACGEGETTVLSWPLPGYWEVKVGAPLPGELRRRWANGRPDVVYVAIETPLGFSGASAAISLGIPVIGGFHTNFREYLHKYGADWVGRKVWAYQKWFHERLHRTLVPSPDARNKLVAAGFTKVDVLGRGVDTVLFDPVRRSDSLREKWGVSAESPVVVIVGRISSEKNIELALQAYSRMKEQCPGTLCLVVGDGPFRSRLEREHREVRFTGYLTGERLAECCASADIMLFPSETETFGNVLLEGMASGLAVVAYDYAAASWHCRNGENGMVVPKGDGDAFIAASVALLDANLRGRLGSVARETAKNLSWQSVVAELESIFREVISVPSQKTSSKIS